MDQTPPPLQQKPKPPPLPVEPLNYQSPMPAVDPAYSPPSLAQKAARFSWRAPVVAIVLGFCTMTALNDNSAFGTTVGVINSLLIVGGLFAGVIALFGIRRHGSRGIIVPAIIGTCVNGFIILSLGVFLLSARRAAIVGASASRAAAANASRPPPPRLAPQQIKDSIEKYPGWVGSIQTAGAQIVAVSVAVDSPMARDTRRMLPSIYLMMEITIDNSRNASPIDIDLTNASVNYLDGTVHEPLNADIIFRGSTDPQLSNSSQTLAPRNLSISARKPGSTETTLFLPEEIDLHSIASVTIRVNGITIDVPGRFLSVDEKQYNIRQSKAAAR